MRVLLSNQRRGDQNETGTLKFTYYTSSVVILSKEKNPSVRTVQFVDAM